jgi:hypothetical protein
MWQLRETSLSDSLSREVVHLTGWMTYAQAAQVLERLGQVSIPVTSVWAAAKQQGERLQAQAAHEQTKAGIERIQWQDERYDRRARKGIALDGGMVAVRGEGWKELKVGVAGDIVPDGPAVGENVHLERMHYGAVLGDSDQFQPVLWALAWRQGVPYAGDSAVTADGALWIWRLVADLFPGSAQIVDWYHAVQHVSEAVQARFPAGGPEADDWLEALKAWLYRGELKTLIRSLSEAGLGDHSLYFHRHQRRMQYQEFREQGYPIGSGAIESGIKQYKQRLCGPGMRWSRPGVARMAVIRSAVLSNDFDRLWDAA